MSEKVKSKAVYLQKVDVIYAHINKPWSYQAGDKPRYSLSVLVNKEDDNYKEFLGGLKEVLKENGITGDQAKKLLGQKIKAIPEAAKEKLSDANEDSRMLSLTTLNKPNLYKFDGDDLVKSDEVRVLPEAVVNVMVKFYFHAGHRTLSAWPIKISVVEESTWEDVEDESKWLETNEAKTVKNKTQIDVVEEEEEKFEF